MRLLLSERRSQQGRRQGSCMHCRRRTRSASWPILLLVVVVIMLIATTNHAAPTTTSAATTAGAFFVGNSAARHHGAAKNKAAQLRDRPRGASTAGAGEGGALSGTTPAATTTTRTLTCIKGLGEVANDYDVFLLDLWGVLLDGTRPYEGVIHALQQLRQWNKRLIVLSNSSKRRDHSIRMLTQLGFDVSCFETIITSGELAHQMLSGTGEWLEYCRPWGPLARDGPDGVGGENDQPPRRAFCLGSGDGDAEYLRSCGWTLSGVEEADLIVARGTFTIDDGTELNRVHKRDDPARYEALLVETLRKAAHRRIPMLVCNPDKVRPDRDRPPMPGQLGDRYELLLRGGPTSEAIVKRVGKPDPDVYAIALQRRPTPDGEVTSSSANKGVRACMVGDALETDVTGGSQAGIDTIWVLDTGIHGPDLARCKDCHKEGAAQVVLDEFNAKPGTYAKGRKLSPSLLLPSFRW